MHAKSGIYEELGVRRVINAWGHPTLIGGNHPFGNSAGRHGGDCRRLRSHGRPDRRCRRQGRRHAGDRGGPGVEGIRVADFPDGPLAEGLRIRVQADRVGKTAQQAVDELRSGNPQIMVREDGEADSLIIRIQTVNEGDERFIAERLQEILV